MKRSVIISVTLSLVGLAVLMSGLTGMSTVDLGKSYCNAEKDCPETCCLFYNSNNGVCDKPSNCNSIKLLSMEQTKRISSSVGQELSPSSKLPKFITSNIQVKGKTSIVSSIVASGILFLISLFILMIGNRRGI